MQFYTLQKKEWVPGLESTVFHYVHETGAEVLYVQNEDPHRVFSINFKTPPENDKGIPHILEHIILNGSARYCEGDPFSLLMKNALYSYLNAITFKDKTIYTAASDQAEEFKKIFHVYLDCMFNPLLRRKDFLQEGLQMQIREAEEVDFSGVVYNEMVGVYSNERSWYQYKTFQQLFADHFQQYDSAGVPPKIQDVSYEEVLSYYQRYYTKNNCFVYLYGAVPMAETLEYLHTHYLGVETRMETVGKQTLSLLPAVPKERQWMVTENSTEGATQHNHLWIAYRMDEMTNQQLLALEIVMEAFFYSNQGKWKEALKKEYGVAGWDYWMHKDGCVPVLMLCCEGGHGTPKDVYKRWLHFFAQPMDMETIQYFVEKKSYEVYKQDYGYKPKGLALQLQFIQRWMEHQPFLSEMVPTQWVEAFQDHHFQKIFFQQVKEVFVAHNQNFVCQWFVKAKEQKRAVTSPVIIPPMTLSRETIQSRLLDSPIEDNGDIAYIPIAPKGFASVYCYFYPQPVCPHYYELLGILKQWMMKRIGKENIHGTFLGEQNLNLVVTNAEEVLIEWSFTGRTPQRTVIMATAQQIFAQSLQMDLKTLSCFLRELYISYQNQFRLQMDQWSIMRSQGSLEKSAQWLDAFEGMGLYIYVAHLCTTNTINEALLQQFQMVYHQLFIVPYKKWHVACEAIEKESWILALQQLKSSQEVKNKKTIETEIDSYDNDRPLPRKSFLDVPQGLFTNVYSARFENGLDGLLLLAFSILQKGILHEKLRNKGGCYFVGLSYTTQGMVSVYTKQDPHFGETLAVFSALDDLFEEMPISETQLQWYKTDVLNQWLRLKHPLVTGRERLHQQLQGMEPAMYLEWYNTVATATVVQVKAHFRKEMANRKEISFVSVGDLKKIRSEEKEWLDRFDVLEIKETKLL